MPTQLTRKLFALFGLFFMLEMMVEAGYPREKLVCLPTFTDTNRFSPPETGASRDYIVCLGRLDRPKGIPVLLDALALLRDRNIAVPHLKIAGAGHNQDYVAQLKARVARLNLDEKVEFMGNLPPEQVPDLLRGAKCAVLPALWFENLPNTLVESMIVVPGSATFKASLNELKGVELDPSLPLDAFAETHSVFVIR